jgi:hypothetical protein
VSPSKATNSQSEPSLDWTKAIELYRRGEWSLEQLESHVSGSSLAPRPLVDLTLGIGKALERPPRSYTALKDRLAGKSKPEGIVVALELNERQRHLQDGFQGVPLSATFTDRPPEPVKEMFEANCDFHLQSAKGKRSLHLDRFLNDAWTLVVRITPRDVVDSLQCGTHQMKPLHGTFVLDLTPYKHSKAEVAQLVSHELVIDFSSGERVTLVIA